MSLHGAINTSVSVYDIYSIFFLTKSKTLKTIKNEKNVYYIPKIMVTNVRSLVRKIEEVQEFLNRNQISIAFVTETWLQPTITDSVVNIYRILHGCEKIWILCSSGKNNISRVSAANE